MIISARQWLLLVQLVVAISTSSLFNLKRLSLEAHKAQVASDSAFDTGDLKQSLNEAQYSSLASIFDSQYSKQSTDRIEAIAVGSEATGRPRTALLAWSSLSATYWATRSTIPSSTRISQQSEQHMTYLLSRLAYGPNAAAVRPELLTGSSLQLANHGIGGTPFLLGAGLLIGVCGLLLRRQLDNATRSTPIIGRGLYLLAASCWFIGWIIA